MHTDEFHWLTRVHLDDDYVRTLDKGWRVANRGRRNNAFLRDGDRLHKGNVNLSEEALTRLLRHLGEVHIDVVHEPGVDRIAQRRIRLIREALLDAARFRKCPVKFRSRRGACPDIYFEWILLHALGNGKRNSLRIPRRRKSAGTDGHAVSKVLCRRLRTDDLVCQGLGYTIRNIDHRKTSL